MFLKIFCILSLFIVLLQAERYDVLSDNLSSLQDNGEIWPTNQDKELDTSNFPLGPEIKDESGASLDDFTGLDLEEFLENLENNYENYAASDDEGEWDSFPSVQQPRPLKRHFSMPSVLKREMIIPTVIKRGLTSPFIFKRGMFSPSVIKRGMMPPSILKRKMNIPSILKRRMMTPSVLKRGMGIPSILKRGMMFPTVIKRNEEVVPDIVDEKNTQNEY